MSTRPTMSLEQALTSTHLMISELEWQERLCSSCRRRR